jgi:hypothetical protein
MGGGAAGLPPTPSTPVGAPNDRPRWAIRDIPSVWSLDAHLSWIVPDILSEGAVTLLTGDSGAGKSTLALSLCGAVARGGGFLGRLCQKRPVLYMDRENPLSVVRERLERLGIAETPDLIVWGSWTDPPTDGPTAPAVLQFVRDERPLIVFDSLVAYHTGSEQDASETRRHMQAYRNLASQGATVLVLHHTGKSQGARDYRGSSDIKAAVDMAWLLENLGDPGRLETLRLKPFKSRIALASPMRVEYADGLFHVDNQRAETNREIVERIISENPSETQSKVVKLAHAAGVAKHRTEELLADGARKGWLAVDIGARGAKTYRPGVLEVSI